jgi:predicted O-methyltransferase YrrM
MGDLPPKDQMLARLREIGPRIEPIQGWLDPNAGGVMYQIACHQAPTPNVVELGSWKGRSTAWLAWALADRGEGKVVAIDTWQGTATEAMHAELLRGYGPDQLYEEFLLNMGQLGLRDHVEPWRMTTLEAARRWDRGASIGVLHVDASHEYADVRADFEHWAPYVAEGGFIVFDDVPGWMGPTRLVSELPRWYQYFVSPPNQWWVRKLPPT